jgi:hypothetical protein
VTCRDLSQYYGVQDQIKTGDLVEWRGTGLVARTIRLFTRRKVNHSSLIVRLPYKLCERRYMIEALEGGLEFRLLSKRLEDYAGEAWWYGLKPEYHPLRREIGQWAFDRLSEGKGYDYQGLVAQIFGRVSADARRFFCSEFIDLAYQIHGIIGPDPHGARRPGDFVGLGIFEASAKLL